MLASVVLAAALAVLPVQEKVVEMPDLGTITYNESTYSLPDTERVYSLSLLVFEFIKEKCSCNVDWQGLGWDVNVVPYEEFERTLNEFWPDNTRIADGLTYRLRGLPPVTYFYQWPTDELIVHELLHIAYPPDDEKTISGKTAHLMGSDMYREWARER